MKRITLIFMLMIVNEECWKFFLFTFPGNVLFTFSSLNVQNNEIVIKRMYCLIISGITLFISI